MELFRKKDSRFYWYDFKVRGKRYRRSTKETNKKRAEKIAAIKLSQAMGGTGLLDRRAPSLQGFSTGFLNWVESAALARKSKKYYCNGWRLLSKTHLVGMRLDHITKDDMEGLNFSGTASNTRIPTVHCELCAGWHGRNSHGFTAERISGKDKLLTNAGSAVFGLLTPSQ